MVSVIVPIFNAERYLSRTLDSVLAQSYTDWECILVDDGSTDSSAAVAQRYADADPRFRCVSQPNGGVAKARNTGLDLAAGEFTAFLDSDDLWLPGKLETSVNELIQGDVDLLFTEAYSFRTETPPADPSRLPRLGAGVGTYRGPEGIALFLLRNPVPTLTVVAKTEAVRRTGGFKGRLAEDYRLWLEMLYNGCTLRGTGEPTALYRVREGSLSSNDRFEAREVLSMLKELCERFPHVVDYKPAARKWVRRYLKAAFRKGNEGFVGEQIGYWGIGTPAIGRILAVGERMPAWLYKLVLKQALK